MIIWMAGWGQICRSIIRQASLSLVTGFPIGRRNGMGSADGRPSRYHIYFIIQTGVPRDSDGVVWIRGVHIIDRKISFTCRTFVCRVATSLFCSGNSWSISMSRQRRYVHPGSIFHFIQNMHLHVNLYVPFSVEFKVLHIYICPSSP
jgi:hypothetical protein